MRRLFGAAVVALAAALMFPAYAQERGDSTQGQVQGGAQAADPRVDDPLTRPGPAASGRQISSGSAGTGGGAQAGTRAATGAAANAPQGQAAGAGAPPAGQRLEDGASAGAAKAVGSGQETAEVERGDARPQAGATARRPLAPPEDPARQARPPAGAERPEDATPPRARTAQADARRAGSGLTTIDQSELDVLHQRITELVRENDALRARLAGASAPAAGTATGGGGTAGTGGGTAAPGGGAGTTGGTTGGTGGGTARATAPAGEPVVSVDFVGVIQRVTPSRIDVLDEDGNVYDLVVDPRTRALRNGERIPLAQLQQGSPVRASFDQIAGLSRARELEVLPPEEVQGLNLPGLGGAGMQGAPRGMTQQQGQQVAAGGQTGVLSNRELLRRQPPAVFSAPPGTQPVDVQPGESQPRQPGVGGAGQGAQDPSRSQR